MSKRCDKFKRRAQDAYDTPEKALLPLLPHLPDDFSFWEPCAGAGKLFDAICKYCNWRDALLTDIAPRDDFVQKADALDQPAGCYYDLIITNPPWTREILHPMISHFRAQAPSWLLFDADWAHTKQAIPYLTYCHKIVSVGRVSWMENGTSGKDNCAWYLFDKVEPFRTEFVGRAA